MLFKLVINHAAWFYLVIFNKLFNTLPFKKVLHVLHAGPLLLRLPWVETHFENKLWKCAGVYFQMKLRCLGDLDQLVVINVASLCWILWLSGNKNPWRWRGHKSNCAEMFHICVSFSLPWLIYDRTTGASRFWTNAIKTPQEKSFRQWLRGPRTLQHNKSNANRQKENTINLTTHTLQTLTTQQHRRE